MIAVLFAVPHESRGFLRELQGARKGDLGGLALWHGQIAGRKVVVGHVGVGLAAAEGSARQVLRYLHPVLVVSAGYGGGLRPELRAGDVVIDWREVPPSEVALPERCFRGVIASRLEALETPAAKAQFARVSGAHVVEMESAAIAKSCAEAGRPMIGMRGISDALDDALPMPLDRWFDLRRQRPRPIAMLVFLATHPGAIVPFVRFTRKLPAVRRNLSSAITSLLPTLNPRDSSAH